MKKSLLIFVLVVSFNFLNAQSWIWAKSSSGTGGGSKAQSGYAATTDSVGNVYAAGFFNTKTITFGSITLNNSDSTFYDFFLVKYDGNGNVIWARSGGGAQGNDEIYNIKTDRNGNIYITGFFESAVMSIGTFTFANTASTKSFIAKYDSNGNVLWVKKPIGFGNDRSESIAIDAAGNSYITGYYSGTVNFGTGNLTSSALFDFYLVKYDVNGNTVWSKSGSGPSMEEGISIECDIHGDLIVTGRFQGDSAVFDTETLISNNPGYNQLFIVKYDANGNIIWAKRPISTIVTTHAHVGYGVTSDKTGAIYVTGALQSPTMSFGAITLTNSSTSGFWDFFIFKFDGNGNPLWGHRAGSSASDDNGYNACVDIYGNVTVVGAYRGGSISFGSTTLTYPSGPGNEPMFIATYDSTGNPLYASKLSFGGNNQTAVTTDKFGNLFVVSDFKGNAFSVGTTTLSSVSQQGNIFTAKYSIPVTTVDLKLNENNDIIKIFPNPTKGNLELSGFGKQTIEIYDVNGQVVFRKEISNDINHLDVRNLANGIYFISTKNSTQSTYQKLIIAHD